MTKGRRILAALAVALSLAGCATHDVTEVPRTYSTALDREAASTTYLGTWAQQAIAQHDGLSGLRLVIDGQEAFGLRASMAAQAQQTLDVKTYILADDEAGRALLKRMLHAARSGVRVRFLLDDMTTLGQQHMLASLDSHPNVEVRVYNPVPAGRGSWLSYHLVLVSDFNRLHRRMHNKLWVADGVVGLTGGRNLSNEYFAISEEVNFNDLDVMAIGPVVEELSASFDAYWNHPMAVPLSHFEPVPESAWQSLLARFSVEGRADNALMTQSLDRYFVGEAGQALRDSLIWAPAMALWDLPEKLEAQGYPDLELTLLGQLDDAFAALERRLLIISPYVVPTPEAMRYQQALAARGIEVTIITNSIEATDHTALHGAYAPWRPTLLAHGAQLYEVRASPATRDEYAHLHTKAMAFDDDRIFIGSLNADPRAVWWNSEIGLLIDSPILGRQLWSVAKQTMHPQLSYRVEMQEGKLVWHTEEAGERVTLEQEPGSFWQHLPARVVRLLNIDHLL